MARLYKSLFLLAIILPLALASCNRPPELSRIPAIAFSNISFELVNPGDPLFEANVLRLTIDIEDGDGDLGLNGDENGFPYHSFAVVVDDNGVPVEFGDSPLDPPVFTCLDYAVEGLENTDLNADGDLLDTMRIIFNEDQFNIFIDFARKINGTFEEVDIRAQPPGSANSTNLCGQSFDGRFPCLSSDDNPCNVIVNNDRPIKGTLTYDIESSLFLPIFRTDTIKMTIRIQDRALNKSNVIETPEFTLQSIQGG